MISYQCPNCKSTNQSPLQVKVEDFVCSSCYHLIDVKNNKSRKVFSKPTFPIVLEVGMKGYLDGKNFTIVGIVVRHYGSSTYWREYYLKDSENQDVYLSEFDGHWILLYPQLIPLKDNKYWAEFNGKKYRWYETTPSSVHNAAGFFHHGLSLKLATYNEFINGTEMISRETVSDDEFFLGKHISKHEVKNAFKPKEMPSYYGIGVVQPYYFDLKQVINIFGITALLICFYQFYLFNTRANYEVFKQEIKFEDVHNKSIITKSFELKGASAPLSVSAYSDVDNSWANVEVGLVNEKTNVIEYSSKDIEHYSGYEDGEHWTEGSRQETFNFCGVAPGKYHFEIGAQKQGFESANPELGIEEYISIDGSKTFRYTGDGWIDVIDNRTTDKMAYNLTNIKLTDSALAKDIEEAKKYAQANPNKIPKLLEADIKNPSVEITAHWKPVSFWNFGIIMGIMILIVGLVYLGEYMFKVSKWSNSSNSPYPQS